MKLTFYPRDIKKNYYFLPKKSLEQNSKVMKELNLVRSYIKY